MPVQFAKLRAGFFDSPAVTRRLDRAKRRVFVRVGALTRTIARRSIRKRKGVSAPGQPPSSHVGTLRNLIFFTATDSGVTIGPVLFDGAKSASDAKRAPELLEHGGSVVRASKKGAREFRYRVRPFMAPAFEQAQTKFVSQFKDSL